ncbi:MAG: CPBP family intramembrane metalloprotease [Lachnospiraceae bacterium]|nr:CPBP family intramembrane metalloprotease [Lachnospiraceae bacterium]
MNAKKANWTFLSVILFNMVAIVVLAMFAGKFSMNMIQALLVSQGIVLAPVLLSLLVTRTKLKGFVPCKKIKLTSILLIIAVTYLTLPLISVTNLISMLFVENEANNIMAGFEGISPLIAVLIVGILGPANEEFVFRGVLYHGYRSSGRIIGATVLSAVLFGMMHLNFNQMVYAIVVGIIGVLLIECTGSILSSIIFHATINTTSVITAYAGGTIGQTSTELQSTTETMMDLSYKEMLCVAIFIYMIIAVVTTAIAGCLMYVIARNEKRTGHMQALGQICKVKNNKKLFSIPLWIAMTICMAYMILNEVIVYIAG